MVRVLMVLLLVSSLTGWMRLQGLKMAKGGKDGFGKIQDEPDNTGWVWYLPIFYMH